MADLYEQALAFIADTNNAEKFTPDNMQKLQFYACFKQISEGPCKGPAPSRLKIVEKAKYDAWKALGNITPEEAKARYVKILTDAYPAWNAKPKL